jgi:hypothetical protein
MSRLERNPVEAQCNRQLRRDSGEVASANVSVEDHQLYAVRMKYPWIVSIQA